MKICNRCNKLYRNYGYVDWIEVCKVCLEGSAYQEKGVYKEVWIIGGIILGGGLFAFFTLALLKGWIFAYVICAIISGIGILLTKRYE